MITKDEAITAAGTLKEWCEGRLCKACPFGQRMNIGEYKCYFASGFVPLRWDIQKPCRWTDTDVELAKALKAAGAQVIVLTNTGAEWLSKSPAGTIRYGGKVPPFAFTCVTFADGEIPLDTIIQEAKEG